MIEDNNVIQDTPIITDEEIKPLTSIRYAITKGKAPNSYSVTHDLYLANDTEFIAYLASATKISKTKVIESIGFNGEWNNKNRIPVRLTLVDKFKKNLTSKKAVDK